MSTSPLDLAKRYWLDDVPSAASGGTRLSNILESLSKGEPLTATSKRFLTERGLLALLSLANGEISAERFNQLASSERVSRLSAALSQQQVNEAQKQADQAADDAREAAMWAGLEAERIKRKSDPKFVAKQKGRELRRKYGVDSFVEEHDFKRLMTILRNLDVGSRLPEEDAFWLKTEGRDYSSEEIVAAHNRLEADFCIAEYTRTGDVWKAVGASGHLRKCSASQEASELLMAIPKNRLKQPKLRSAVLTTHGGAMRDLRRHSEALTFGEEAHTLQPDNFRPCTLLGALNIETGSIETGHEWYRKAEERGAGADRIDSELRSTLARMPAEKRDQIVDKLLGIDPVRYSMLRNNLRRRFGAV